MLIECQECHGQISDKALTCPHCGIPLKKKRNSHDPTRKQPRRLPNGFGSITRLNRNLRRPYLARVTNNKDSLGRPQLKSLGYYRTYNEAYSALMEYNKNPFDLDAQITVADTYRNYMRDVFNNENHSTGYVRSVERAFEQSEVLHGMKIRDIRPRHIRACIDNLSGAHAKANLKNFWNRLFDYALAHEFVERNYARDFKLDPKTAKEVVNYKRTHLTFSDAEMRALWKNTSDETVKMILIQCYMGWRPDELCKIELSNVNLETWYIKGGVKTEAGIDRVVPIHSAVRPLVEEQYNLSKSAELPYLFNVNYQHYHYAMKKLCKTLNLRKEHRPHDPRKQFVTMALKSGADSMSVKKIVGHKVSDVTEKAYTERDLEWLRNDIEKIDASVYN